MLTAATCFSGIGAPELGGPQFDWRWSAEFDKGPARILAQRYPDVPNLGDVTADDFIERALARGPLDLLVGGPPCQAFSFAGLRKSLGDDRGNLSLRFMEIAHAIRPRNLLVENVPGWLSTDDNAFGCFLGAVVGGDAPLCHPKGERWPDIGMVAGPLGRAAWRVFDAQFFGLAQRRRRVFVVVDFGRGADPCRVLFERRGLLGNFAPRREAGEGFAADVSPSLVASGRGVERTGETRGQDPVVAVAKTLLSSSGQRNDPETENLLPVIAPTLTAGGNRTGGHRPPRTQVDTAESLIPLVTHTLKGEGFDASEDRTGRGVPLLLVQAFYSTESHSSGDNRDISPTLKVGSNGGGQPPAVAFAQNQLGEVRAGDVFNTLNTNANASGRNAAMAAIGSAVRRLTPRECERLQGFPDGFTLVEGKSWRKVSPEMAEYLREQGAEVTPWNDGSLRTRAIADGPRYKALGNSWAVPCGRWILSRLAAELSA